MASDPMEFPGILKHASSVVEKRLGVHWARTAKLGGHEVLLAANGAGSRRASAAVDAAREFGAEAIMSTGFCGALDEKLRIADVVVATQVVAKDGTFAATPVNGGTAGVVCSVDHVVRTAAEKRRLRESGACAVEMEAAGVGRRAQSLGVEFYCIRAVTDLVSEDIANDFNAALTSDGHFDTMNVLRGALRQPTVRLPELFRLRSRCVRAARILGDFIADCRF